LVVGLIGSLVGVGFGILLSFGLRAMLAGFGLELPSGGLVLAPRTIIISVVLGTLVTIVASLFPAVRASRITPVEALREASAETWQRNTVRVFIGLAIVAISAVAILFGLLAPEIALAGLGVGLMFIGVIVLGPSIARPIARVLGSPISRFGLTGRLARDNSMRNPKRTARTAAALTIGIALVAGITVLFSSLTRSIEETVSEGFFGDVVIDSGSLGAGGGFSPQLAASVRQLDEVDVAATLRVGLGELEGDGDVFLTFDQGAFELFDVDLIEGTTELVGEQILLYENRAADLGVGLGDTVTVKLPDGIDRELEVVGIYADPSVVDSQAISHELYEQTGAEQLDFAIYTSLADGVDVATGRAAIEAVTEDFPNAEILDRDEFLESATAELQPVLGLITGLLALAIIIAAFGIANTLRLSTIERTREIGLLRAVGMTQGQVQSTIRWEAVITAVFGSVLGVLLGLFLGWAVIRALRDQGVTSFSVPILSLLGIVLAGAIVGLLASIVPAYRASKLNILEAIAA
jgi:putative ABC transport system permease protein